MILGKPCLRLFFYKVLGCGMISDVCWFHRSFLDELKACVTSGDIEGIVCLTAVLHIILIINKGWLHFLSFIWCYWSCPCLLLMLEMFGNLACFTLSSARTEKASHSLFTLVPWCSLSTVPSTGPVFAWAYLFCIVGLSTFHFTIGHM